MILVSNIRDTNKQKKKNIYFMYYNICYALFFFFWILLKKKVSRQANERQYNNSIETIIF